MPKKCVYRINDTSKQEISLRLPLETKQKIENAVENEMAFSEDNQNVEKGIKKFIEWIKEGKPQIRAYPSQNIHAKLYIMTFREGDRV